MDALTPHARPPLTQTIAPNVQAQIDAARTATPIELGVLGSVADEPFLPDELTAAGGPAPLPPQARAIYSGGGCEITETWSSTDGYNHNRSLLYNGCGSGGGGAGATPLLGAGSFGAGPQGVESCEPNSFVPGTRVLMADGSSKVIEEVREGEEVLATDLVTGETTSRRVAATITGEGQKDLVEITVDTDGPAGDETGVLVATDGHPFWAPDQHRWVEAGELVVGDQLQGPDGTQLQVVSVKTWTALQKVHNLTIDDTHMCRLGQAGSGAQLNRMHRRVVGCEWEFHFCATYDKLGGRQITSTVVERESGPTRNLTTRISHDPLGNPAKATTPTGLTTTYSHDDLGNRLSVTDPAGLTTTTRYDAAGRTTSIIEPSSVTTAYGYDLARTRDDFPGRAGRAAVVSGGGWAG
ncbi:polymorphic toxin-type HINT domain-containing protein [Saccharopolyspora shandongensis]|uniref:polymorphic toxin-type HINT domain-containing protein n=1 Tax=Saccharopolyspora shandongensis TaxID=418495 RepID=UPI0033E7494A